MAGPQTTSWTGPDMLSGLPAELHLHIMSNLTAKSLISLKYTNRKMNTVVSTHEKSLSRSIINQQSNRISDDCNFMNLRGLSIEEGLRRWCKCSDIEGVRDGFDLYTVRIGNEFIVEYLEQNKGKYPNQWLLRCMFVSLILKVDYWFQHGGFPLTMHLNNPEYTNDLDITLHDAVDNFDDLGLAVPENRWEHVINDSHLWLGPGMAEELRVIFDNIQYNPILVRLEWPRDHVLPAKHPFQSDDPEQLETFFLPRAVDKQIAPERRKFISGFHMSLATTSKCAAKVANRYAGTKKDQKRGLNWAALLESIEVDYADHNAGSAAYD